MRYRVAHRAVAASVLVLVGALAWRAPPAAHAQEVAALAEGCTNVTLAYPAGTPVASVAGAVQPATALAGIFRYDTALGRFVAFSPVAPPSANDYVTTGAPLEAVFICMASPGTLTRAVAAAVPTPQPVAPPTIGVISAPRDVRRGEIVTVLIGASPRIACLGGVNVPGGGGTFRFVPIEAVTGSSGTAIIRFETFESDTPGWAYLGLRCGDGLIIRLEMRVL